MRRQIFITSIWRLFGHTIFTIEIKLRRVWFYTFERKWFSALYSPAESLYHYFLCVSHLSQHHVRRVVNVANKGRWYTFIALRWMIWGAFPSLLSHRAQTHCKSQQLPYVIRFSIDFSSVLLSTLVNCYLFQVDAKAFNRSSGEKRDLANVKEEADKSKIQLCSFPSACYHLFAFPFRWSQSDIFVNFF